MHNPLILNYLFKHLYSFPRFVNITGINTPTYKIVTFIFT